MCVVGLLEKNPFPICRAMEQALRAYALDAPVPPARLIPSEAPGTLGYCDVLIVSGGHASGRLPPCRFAVMPGEMAGPLSFQAESVVTYGLSRQDTITISSTVDDMLALAIQREIVDVYGRRTDRQEILLRRPAHLGLLQTLASAGGLLLVGVESAALPGILSPGRHEANAVL